MKKTTHADPSGFFYQRTCREGLPEGRLAGALPGLPLTAAVLDRYCAPYICGYGAGARPVASLESFLRSDLRTLGLGMHPENPAIWDRFIDQLYIFNYREDPQGHPIPQSVGTCFGAGWWCASFRVSALFPEGNPLEHTEQAEALLALLGKPTQILPEGSRFTQTLEEGRGRLRYRLIYEKEGYVLVFRLSDAVFPEYGINALSIDSCLYYPTPCWEKERPSLTCD